MGVKKLTEMLSTGKRILLTGKTKNIPSITVTSIHKSYFHMGCPTEEGSKIQVRMKSDKIAIYKLKNSRQFFGDSDEREYIFRFSHYKKPGEKDYPLLPVEGDTIKRRSYTGTF